MERDFSKLKKRDGRIVDFDKKKIADAIYKSVKATGGKDKKLVNKLSERVIELMNSELKNEVPTVEDVQDFVERVLIEEGQAKVAKAYILYRQKRAEARAEKAKLLDKEAVDEIDKRFDLNALRVLKSRYLKKNELGKAIESPKELFSRIAVHVGLADVMYDQQVFNINGNEKTHKQDDFDCIKNENKFSIGKYKLNRYHLEALKRVYDRANRNGQIKISWDELLDLIKNNKLDSYEKSMDEYFDIMTNKRFMPNTPAIANFGNRLGMGSACFHPNQLVITLDGPKNISEINVGDKVLTHRGRFRNVKQIFIRETNSLLSFQCRKLPRAAMLVTEEHPILTYKDGEMGWYPAYMIKEKDKVALSYPNETKDVEKIKVSGIVKDVTIENDKCYYEYKGGKFDAFVHTTKSVNETIEVDYDLMKLFGFYLAEGNVSENDCVRFTLSVDEMEYCNEIISIMERKFGITARIETNSNPERKWLSLRFHSTILAKFFENIFGTGYNEKKIPNWITLLPVEKQKGLMSGMIRGDGTIFKNWNKMNAKLVMSNTNLVYAFWQMCMRCGVFASLRKEKIPKLGNTEPFICTLGDSKGQLLMNELFRKKIQEVVSLNKTFIINGFVFTDVEKIEKINYQGPVFNLEVEEDHSYVANMVSVHNCFVLDVDDSLESIMGTLGKAAMIFQAGGGLGYNFSRLRPEGDYVASTSGQASGPLSFMRLYDTMTEVIKQGGIRRGANMGIMNSNHPDIEKFITAKKGNQALKNFNISVLITSDFWEYYKKNEPYPLINPRNKQIVRTVNPKMLLDLIVYQAWESAEPGVIFFDHVNKYNPFFEHLGPIVTTNPCGEVLLYGNESCNLGSINVWAFAKETEDEEIEYDWNGLAETVRTCTKFLDNVIDVNNYPLKEIEEMTLATRKIGLGVMGVGDLLFELGIPFNSEEGRKFMEKIMQFINYHSKLQSIELAKERGILPYFDKSFYPQGRLPFSGFDKKDEWDFDWNEVTEKIKKHGIRNGYTTIIAPTGSISMIAGCSSGMEPVYSLVFEKHVAVGSFYYVNPIFEKILREHDLFDEELIAEISKMRGSIQNIKYVPAKVKKIFVTAMDMTPEDHIRALASFQKWIDSSISKTNNFPANATVDDMKSSYLLAYELGCKDVTVFRDTSIAQQVLVGGKQTLTDKKGKDVQPVVLMTPPMASANPSNVKTITRCPECNTQVNHDEGCVLCPGCGWGLCA
ncbi:MAG: adenosylcobalamin-dependent ribonucleoside-diphosphate reductase [Candidatus Aenigmarchaeota archaeon]|nr:adenosylcobalamin-dependent ribonucleoside-diphosphate reductase [Candidatus Aenigmarchaeota archaeon]